jgi:CheY-like chemotaxis protein
MKKNILAFLVDDDLDDHEFFQLAVEKLHTHINCAFATNGVKAIEKLTRDTKFIPDFIFIDINMPLMNGMDCLREIKKIRRLKEVPVYMFTTYADEFVTKNCIELGAAGVLRKMPSISGLHEALSEILLGQKVNL